MGLLQAGARLERLGLADFVGTAEIQKIVKVSRQRVYQLTRRSSFPEPAAVLASGTVWVTAEVIAWIRVHRPADLP
ncbi:AlpA family phage regulatory protein [Actinoplanes sp. NBRC 101535]|uniref:helix-turn-helix transcriptional regulator n=1 Tax=Actinoplanes sp. NBRC 101535 TaxID=3032196 RepID=UPI0025575853|nr:AlpA family phage regulatory protein [Actinoplanes sp. NBRC 101535]